MSELSLADLVRNRTLSAGMAGLLAAAAEERRSLLVVAIPRGAGKTTVLEATLAHRPSGVPLHAMSREHGPMLGIPNADTSARYLVIAEIAPGSTSNTYLWGADVQQVFEAARASDHRIATALHADGIDSAFKVIAQSGVTDEQATLIDVVADLRSIGPWNAPERRALAALYEVDRVEAGRPAARLIHRWIEASDTFEEVGEPRHVSASAYSRHLERFEAAG